MPSLFQRHPGLASGLMFGLLFGVATTVLQATAVGRGGLSLIIWFLVAAVPGGLIFGLLLPRSLRSLTSGVSHLPVTEQRDAWRAARSGPVPDAPALRQRAADLARRQRARTSGWMSRAALIAFVILAASSVWLAAESGHWWRWLAAVFFLGMAIMNVGDARRWKKRVEVLEATAAPPKETTWRS